MSEKCTRLQQIMLLVKWETSLKIQIVIYLWKYTNPLESFAHIQSRPTQNISVSPFEHVECCMKLNKYSSLTHILWASLHHSSIFILSHKYMVKLWIRSDLVYLILDYEPKKKNQKQKQNWLHRKFIFCALHCNLTVPLFISFRPCNYMQRCFF